MSKISGIETHCAFDKSVDEVDLIPHPRNPIVVSRTVGVPRLEAATILKKKKKKKLYLN